MRSLTTLVRVGLAAACCALTVAEDGAAQVKKDKWLEFVIGTNYNGRDWQVRDPLHFAEIRLRITHLSDDDIKDVKRLATTGTALALDTLKQLLKQRLPDDTVPVKNAKQEIIEALMLRSTRPAPEAAMGEAAMGIDWVNLGTGEDFSGEPSLGAAPGAVPGAVSFVEVHLRIPLTVGTKGAIEEAAAARDFKAVSWLLEDALVEAGTANPASLALVKALKFRKEKVSN